jgi:hypothetical protein
MLEVKRLRLLLSALRSYITRILPKFEEYKALERRIDKLRESLVTHLNVVGAEKNSQNLRNRCLATCYGVFVQTKPSKEMGVTSAKTATQSLRKS